MTCAFRCGNGERAAPPVPGVRPFRDEPLSAKDYLRISERSTYCMMPPLR
ncbi:hypothetical protein SGRIM119S_04394 [Streptomyces griseorubiginosus]